MADRELLFSIGLSLKVATVATVLVVFLGVPMAYVLAKKEFPLKRAVELTVMLPLVFSPTVTGYILLLLLGKRGVIGALIYRVFGKTILFTWYAAVVASVVAAMPLFVKTAQAAFAGVDDEYIYVSYTLGRGKLYTFFKIVLPLSKHGVIAGTVLAFARAMGEFGATLMLAGNIPMKTTTIPIEIYNAVSSAQFEKANVLLVVTAVISCGVLLMVNRVMSRWSV
ncbi:molybdate ABC transporter permease subunit [Thermosulfidibacter takaii]|uniref:molybdate ABC transporter permease subunit n=1 Tax=Thermosulfidibacter takaii TaxID=412593 RepID=UPI00083912CD|nr:molybdate ABC transporter permease subunit [Thermosulfidibacter takaii]